MRMVQGFSHTDAIIHFPHLVLSTALPPSREEAVTGCRLCYLLHYGIVSEFPLSFVIKQTLHPLTGHVSINPPIVLDANQVIRVRQSSLSWCFIQIEERPRGCQMRMRKAHNGHSESCLMIENIHVAKNKQTRKKCDDTRYLYMLKKFCSSIYAFSSSLVQETFFLFMDF